jgi:ATP-dependent Clp protease, protease subunit
MTEVEEALERDNFMTAEEALAFGHIDKIMDKRPENQEGKK